MIAVNRAYSYSDERGLAFDLGHHFANLQIDLVTAMLSNDVDDLDRLLLRMEQLYNVISGGTRSFPARIDPARPDVAADHYRTMRQAALGWLFSTEHQDSVDKFNSQTTANDPQHFKGSSYESAMDERRLTGMCCVNGSSPFDFDGLYDRWFIPINSILGDLGYAASLDSYNLGRNFADVEFALGAATAVDTLLRSKFTKLVDVCQNQFPDLPCCDPTTTNKTTKSGQLNSTSHAGKDGLRETLTRISDHVKDYWKIPRPFYPGVFDKPYMIVDEAASVVTFLGRRLDDLQHRQIELLVLLCKGDGGKPISLAYITKITGLDDDAIVVQYTSRIRKSLREILATVNLPHSQNDELRKWISKLGTKKRTGTGTTPASIIFRKAPASDVSIV